ncbi:unnamed protein product [Effrenium voratum]|nr:unnamed protein product [Effrenium voratum]
MTICVHHCLSMALSASLRSLQSSWIEGNVRYEELSSTCCGWRVVATGMSISCRCYMRALHVAISFQNATLGLKFYQHKKGKGGGMLSLHAAYISMKLAAAVKKSEKCVLYE